MPLRNLAWLVVVPGLVGLGLAVGYTAPAPEHDYKLVRRVVEVLAEVDANFVRELSDEEREKLVEDMINGGLHKLDPHSQYLNETHLKAFEVENEGSYGGVGVVLSPGAAAPRLRVASLLAGTPAYDAGLVAGDVILKVGDEDARDMPIDRATKLIKGETGTQVTLTIGRNGKEFPVTLTRSRVAMHPVTGVSRRADDPTRWNWFADEANKIGYVRVSGFSELTTKEAEAAVRELEAAGARGLVLDLRDNPGGLLSEAIKLSDLFLTEGKIVTTKDRRGGEKATAAKAAGTLFLPADGKPVAVLVNGGEHGSASASEIVAAALQDNGRAVVVGERSYGKGSVQSLFRLPPDQKAAVKLTTQTWWRPSGKNMDRKLAEAKGSDEWGVVPDDGLAVSHTRAEELRRGVELQKLDYVAGKPDVVAGVFGKTPPAPPPLLGKDGKPLVDESKPFEDRQLQKALEHLRKKLGVVGRRVDGAVPALYPA
ncbi:MAG: S41 family peptidase [Isosphaera sp.]|nr:S41 family peptidase [Isosphaera sp.]